VQDEHGDVEAGLGVGATDNNKREDLQYVAVSQTISIAWRVNVKSNLNSSMPDQ